MDEEEWMELLTKLVHIQGEFNIAHMEREKGKNKKIRDQGEYKANIEIHKATSLLRQNKEAYNLVAGEKASDFQQAIDWDEFEKPWYFGDDLSKIIKLIQSKIKSIN